MKEILTGDFAARHCQRRPVQGVRVINWNIDRGLRLAQITEFLVSQDPDVVILQEADLNARRTHRLNIAEELARKLQMNYVFGREFQELTQESPGSPAFHGQVTLSHWPQGNPRLIRFRCQSGFWRPRWFVPQREPFQKRLGGRIALVTELNLLGRMLAVYNLHLESRGNNQLRISQLEEVLQDTGRYLPRIPTLAAGDFNFDVSRVPSAAGMETSGFRNALDSRTADTTPGRGIWRSPRCIDWLFVAGPVQPISGRVHVGVPGSDHYPISLVFRCA